MLSRLALIVGIGLLAAPPALACSCLCDQNTTTSAAQIQIDKAAFVFRGTVIFRQNEGGKNADAVEDIFRVKPSLVLKGTPTGELTLYSPSNGAMCGVGWQRGEVQDVIAFRTNGKLHVNLCGQVCAGKAGVFKLLEKDGRPVQ